MKDRLDHYEKEMLTMHLYARQLAARPSDKVKELADISFGAGHIHGLCSGISACLGHLSPSTAEGMLAIVVNSARQYSDKLLAITQELKAAENADDLKLPAMYTLLETLAFPPASPSGL